VSRTGVLLVNTGTPEAPTSRSVRRYLREFLSDPRVVDLPAIPRALLLHLVILPFRPRRSAAAYREIWTDRGSPLLVHGRDLVARVAASLGGDAAVELGMRYGRPSVAEALERLADAEVGNLVAVPLFPQDSEAARESAVAKVREEAGRRPELPEPRIVDAFHGHSAFLDAMAAIARPILGELEPDRVLLSFHGLPERHVRKADPSGTHCLSSPRCCDRLGDVNRKCYRAQCVATARDLAARLALGEGSWEYSFQSRLGHSAWIGPATEDRVRALATRGVRRLAVLTPSFVADGLETLEEIGIRAREEFRVHGGEELHLVPSLNATDEWVEALIEIAGLGTDP
jgi:ferrochelatase